MNIFFSFTNVFFFKIFEMFGMEKPKKKNVKSIWEQNIVRGISTIKNILGNVVQNNAGLGARNNQRFQTSVHLFGSIQSSLHKFWLTQILTK